MKIRITLPLVFLLMFSVVSFAQVGIGTTNPDASSSLEILSNNSGLLIPRIALTSATDNATINNPADYLLVFNTQTSETLAPGLVYWKDNTWKRLLNTDDATGGSGDGSGDGNDWKIGGNAFDWSGTADEFIGTTTYDEFNIKVNNVRMGNFHPNGGMSFGRNATISGSHHSVAIGENADASGNQDAFAIGTNAVAATNKSVALGYGAKTAQTSAIAIGTYANSTGTNAYAIGRGAYTASNATDSYAIGDTATVSGSRSYAIGYGAKVTTEDAFAIGSNAVSQNSSTMAYGNGSLASGVRAYAFGHGANATGLSTLAIGENAVASNNNSIALGVNSNSSHQQTMALGYNSKASAKNAVAVGVGASASNTEALAVGYNADASGQYAVAIGYKAEAPNQNTVIIGNDGTAGGSYNSWWKSKVGIGTYNPTANLHLDGTFRYVDGTQGAGKVLVSDANGNASWADASTVGSGSGSGSASTAKFAEMFKSSGTQSLSASGANQVQFGTINYSDGVNAANNNNTLQVSVSGVYKVTYMVSIEKPNGTDMSAEFYLSKGWSVDKVNGSSSFVSLNSNNKLETLSATKLVHLDAWDVVSLYYNVTDYTGNAGSVSDSYIKSGGTTFYIELVKQD